TIDSNVEIKSVDIYSITGAKVYSKPFTSNEIDLTDFQSGIYLVVLNDGVKRHTLRIVKQ
ncbi:MAG TPA: T9SS type A sorting domain-containing protein, partial [Tenuifilaceae bacterium]|nr:T9SS type A sorting domain-containing protein [Tenuifilaceae bacterium]